MIVGALIIFQKLSPAQEVTGSIQGTITDPSGAPVAKAKVAATDNDRGTVFRTETNDAGFYNLPRVPVGTYSVRVEHPGFNIAQQQNVPLELNQAARVDIALALGNVSTLVNVTESAPVVQTDTTQLGMVMEANAIAALPLETRNYNQLALLTPGAVTTSPGAFNTGQTTFNAGRPYINGNREQANYYLLDGLDNNEFVDNNVAYSPNVDAIQEFNVITNNPGAEFGQFLGGVISVSLKLKEPISSTGTFLNFCGTISSTPMNGPETSAPILLSTAGPPNCGGMNSAAPSAVRSRGTNSFSSSIIRARASIRPPLQGHSRHSRHRNAPETSPTCRDFSCTTRVLNGCDAGQPRAGGNLLGRAEDGFGSLHYRAQSRCVEDHVDSSAGEPFGHKQWHTQQLE